MAARINWTRDEIILVAAIVADNDWRGLDQNDPRVPDLSHLLQRAAIHPADGRPGSFRNQNGVVRKSWDIASSHPDYTGIVTNGSRLDRQVLDDFISDPARMRQTARAIRNAIADGAEPLAEAEFEGAVEGRLLASLHYRRERSPALRRKKITEVLAADGELSCEVCGFNFGRTYGSRGRTYIEIHHRLPLHASGPTKTQLRDLALLCANCHRMIHVARPWLTVEDLRQLLVIR